MGSVSFILSSSLDVYCAAIIPEDAMFFNVNLCCIDGLIGMYLFISTGS